MKKPLNLKKAIETNRLQKFIAEHSKEVGDKEAFESTLGSMVGKPKVNCTASSKSLDDN